MRNKIVLKYIVMMIAGASLIAAPIAAQTTGAETKPVSVIVTVLGRGKEAAPAVTQDSVSVRQDGEARKVLGWQAVPDDGTGLDLVVYVDGALRTAVAQQLQDVSVFVRTLPPKARTEVVYSYGGETQVVQAMTTDHELAAKALRIPSGRSSASSGLYAGIEDFAKRWPEGGNRRVLLVISNGIDLLRGAEDSYPGTNPDLQSAIEELHRKEISVYTIYASSAGFAGQNELLVSNGQGCLAQLASETGGQSYFEGLWTPINFQPYLKAISKNLGHQYLLTFAGAADSSGKAHLSRLQVGVEVTPKADVLAPDHVFV